MNEYEKLTSSLESGEWKTARELQTRTGLNDRTLRSLAHESKGQVISGQLGYKLTKYATSDEVSHAANWLRHQASKMSDRAFQISLAHTQATTAKQMMELPFES